MLSMESRSKGKQLMSRYRKTMRQAIEEGLTAQQISILKREYAPFKGKTISAARARQLMNILDRFKDQDLEKLAKQDIPFVSSGSQSKLTVRRAFNKGVNIRTFTPFAGQFKEDQEITQEDFDLEEGKMKTIATMFSQGKSAEEIAKKMKLPVDTVKSILGEVKEELEEKIQPFMISYSKYGKHAGFEDAKSLQDLQTKAQKLRAKGFTIDKMGRNTAPVKEDKDHEVSMAVGQVRVMKERLDTIMSFLSSKTDDYNIEGWVQSYITSAEETLTTIADYLDKNPEVQSEQKEGAPEVKKEPKKDTGALEKTIQNLTGQLALMKQKLENEKNKVVKPEPNPETGEVPLRTGLANAILDKKGDPAELLKKVEKKKELKMSGKSKIEINPKADIGQYSGGSQVNTGNLH